MHGNTKDVKIDPCNEEKPCDLLIHITTKMKAVPPYVNISLLTKCHDNLFITFGAILITHTDMTVTINVEKSCSFFFLTLKLPTDPS